MDLIATCSNLSPPCASRRRTPTWWWRRLTTFSQVLTSPSPFLSAVLFMMVVNAAFFLVCALFKRFKVCNGCILLQKELLIMCYCVCSFRTWESLRLEVAQCIEWREWQHQKKGKCNSAPCFKLFLLPYLYPPKSPRELNKPKLIFGPKFKSTKILSLA